MWRAISLVRWLPNDADQTDDGGAPTFEINFDRTHPRDGGRAREREGAKEKDGNLGPSTPRSVVESDSRNRYDLARPIVAAEQAAAAAPSSPSSFTSQCWLNLFLSVSSENAVFHHRV